MRAILRVLLYAVVGPAMGLVTFMLYVGFFSLVTRGTTSDFPFPALLDRSNYQLAYVYGIGPAVIDGIFATVLTRRLSGAWYGLAVAAFGAVVSAGGSVALGVVQYGGTGIIAVFALCGFVAGFVCAALFGALAALRRVR